MSNSDRLTGPDFLDSVADQNDAQGLPVNAAEFRQRATDWRADQARIEQLEADLARLERQLRSDTERARILDKLKTHLQAANEALAWPPPAAPEPKTLPVPTRVYLTDKAAVIVGTPERGWDDDAQDAHNCDDMGCSTIGLHVLARVPFTDERALSQQPEARGVVDDLIHAASNAATIIRNCVNAREIGEGYAQHADDIDAAIAALTGERNG